MVSSTEENPIAINKPKYLNAINYLIPQGWAFFSKNPTEFKFNIYKKNKNTYIHINTKNVQFKTIFGVNKSNRILPHIIENVLKQVESNKFFTQNSWGKIKLDSLNVISYNSKKIKEHNGDYLIECYKINPWLYYSKNIKNPIKNSYLILKLKCNEKKQSTTID